MNQKIRKSRGIILGVVLVLCVVLGVLAFEAERWALYNHNQVKLVREFSQRI